MQRWLWKSRSQKATVQLLKMIHYTRQASLTEVPSGLLQVSVFRAVRPPSFSETTTCWAVLHFFSSRVSILRWNLELYSHFRTRQTNEISAWEKKLQTKAVIKAKLRIRYQSENELLWSILLANSLKNNSACFLRQFQSTDLESTCCNT